MTIEIKHKITGKVLLKVEAETLVKANLRGADLSEANLRWADLSEAKGEFTFNWGVKLKVVKEKQGEKK
jgi:uncharacterized protein YjbI with pentapeptide repeats